jgi:hypothetical protein
MNKAAAAPATTPVVVEKARRAPAPRRHRLEGNPPPPMRVVTVDQTEAANPGLKGRMSGWIKRADAGEPDFAWLKLCIIRVGRSVFIDDVRFRDSRYQRTALPPAPSRRTDAATDAEAAA